MNSTEMRLDPPIPTQHHHRHKHKEKKLATFEAGGGENVI